MGHTETEKTEQIDNTTNSKDQQQQDYVSMVEA